MKNLFIVWILSSVLYSCATTHPGNMATGIPETNSELRMSVKKNFTLSNQHYSFLEFTIENLGDDWKQFHVTDLGYGGAKSDILKNEKLIAWLEGRELKLRQSRYNTSLLLGSIAAVGMGTAAFSKNKNVRAAGVGTALGAAATDAGMRLSQAQKNANAGLKAKQAGSGVTNVPKSHILTPFPVAPGSFVRKWVVIGVPRKSEKFHRKKMKSIYRYYSSISLKMTEKEGKKNFNLEFKIPFTKKNKKMY